MAPALQIVESEAQVARCLNCDAPLTMPFCGQCSQKAGPAHLTVRELAHEIIQEQLLLDSKILRTIGPLLFRPGFLSSEYNAGRRLRYMRPLTVYLAASLLFFSFESLKAGD